MSPRRRRGLAPPGSSALRGATCLPPAVGGGYGRPGDRPFLMQDCAGLGTSYKLTSPADVTPIISRRNRETPDVMGCLQTCFKNSNLEEVSIDQPTPKLGLKGDKVKVDGSGTSASGVGLAMCAVELEQDKAYWEVKVIQAGTLWIGVKAGGAALGEVPEVDMDRGDMDIQKVWGLHGDDAPLKGKIKDGTVLAMSYNQASGPPAINFFVDGELLADCEIEGIRGVVSPTIGIGEGATLKCNFGHSFECKPSGRYEQYDGVMLAGKMI